MTEKEITKQIEECKELLASKPRGTLIYKTIKGKKQPYLQWTENGKSYSRYIKVEGREELLIQIEEAAQIKSRLHDLEQRLRAYAEQINTSYMQGEPAIGAQRFEDVVSSKSFYVDKTGLIKKWWERNDEVTLVLRPRRFGKTLNLSMMECFFSPKYKGRTDLFLGLDIWNEKEYRELQGTVPTISLSFASVKRNKYNNALAALWNVIVETFREYQFILKEDSLNQQEKESYQFYTNEFAEYTEEHIITSVNRLSYYLSKHYGQKVIILMDEYDTPMQEAWVHGYWKEMSELMRGFFSSSLKNNKYVRKSYLTGITRVGKESIFSDMNNLNVSGVKEELYAEYFGFTQEEVFKAMDRQGLKSPEIKNRVKQWYDGYCYGNRKDIYNPWSICKYLSEKRFECYWANTSSNDLVGQLIKKADNKFKTQLEGLLQGESIAINYSDNVEYTSLNTDMDVVWSLLLYSGYLTMVGEEKNTKWPEKCSVKLVNREVRMEFERQIKRWFKGNGSYNDFIKALFANDVDRMNYFLNHVAMSMVSCFDAGSGPSDRQPERFYHGLVLGLLVDLQDEYAIRSNRESGFGRYDVMLVPKDRTRNAYVIEFKVQDELDGEKELKDTLRNALRQIEEKAYEQELLDLGIEKERIFKYGMVFCGKKVLVGSKER